MATEKEKITRAKEILRAMAEGTNPFTGAEIPGGSFLDDPRMIRCLHFVQEVLTAAEAEGQSRASVKSPPTFLITAEEKSRIALRPERIGVNEFAKCVNAVTDPERSRKLSGVEINRQLKKMGVLGEEALGDGKTRTVPGPRAGEYGISSAKRNYNGQEYEMILFDEKGKQFLLDNLEKIMELGAAG